MLRHSACTLLLCVLGAAVASAQGDRFEKISATEGNFVETVLRDNDLFGFSVANLGDLDGDGVADLAVGAPGDDDGGPARGAVWIVFLREDGTVKSRQKISAAEGGFAGELGNGDAFGSAVTNLGDLDGDSTNAVVTALAVGAFGDDDGGPDRGAVWVLFLDSLGTVQAHQKISDGEGGLPAGSLSDGDAFGFSLAALGVGDVNSDGAPDLAVGAYLDDDGGLDRGAVWVLFLDSLGTVQAHQKISDSEGGFPAGSLDDGDLFGSSVAGLDDLDDDGVPDLAVGASEDDDGGDDEDSDRGAVWVLFLNRDGTIKVDDDDTPKMQKISATEGGFTGALNDGDVFGVSVAGLGGLGGDEAPDLAVGAYLDDDGGPGRGAVWVLALNRNGTVNIQQKISDSEGSFRGTLEDNDFFGFSLAGLDDLDGDGVLDLAVGAFGVNDTFEENGGETERGAVWMVFLTESGRVATQQKISTTEGNLTSVLKDNDRFGRSVAGLGDLDGDDVPDLAVGAPGTDDGGADRGAVWVLFLNRDDSTVTTKAQQKISDGVGGFPVDLLGNGDAFGTALADLGDLDGDGVPDLAVGAPGDDDGGTDQGAVWVLLLNSNGTIKAQQKISDTKGNFAGSLNNRDAFGSSVAGLGDLDGDGVPDLAVGAPGDDDGGPDQGTVWILFLNRNGMVASHRKISDERLRNGNAFGSSVANLGDLDGDPANTAVTALAVGAPGDDDGGTDQGAVWVLFLTSDAGVEVNDDGTSKTQKISATEGGFTGELAADDAFGSALAGLGDGGAIADLAVGAPGDDDGGAERGAVWVLVFNSDGTIKEAHQKVSATEGTAAGDLNLINNDDFGSALAGVGDIDNDAIADLAIGAPGNEDGGPDRGAVWLNFREVSPQIDESVASMAGGGSTPLRNMPIDVSARVTDNRCILPSGNATISFRRAGDQAGQSILLSTQMSGACVKEGDRFTSNLTATIPAIFADTRGVEYFIEVVDDAGLQTRFPQDTFKSIPIRIPDQGILNDTPQPALAPRFISVPLDLDDKNPSAVLEDDLGRYDNTKWRFWDLPGILQESSNTFRLDEFPTTPEMEPGKAFLLVVKEEQGFDTGPGTTLPTDQPYAIPLEPGWNLIGNPFHFDIPVEKLALQSTGDSPEFRFYEEDGTWNVTLTNPVTLIKPFEGYAVFTDMTRTDDDTLFVDPNLSPLPQSAVARSGGVASQEDALWSIRILAQSGQARDVDNVAMVAADAAPAWDPRDRPEPPVFGDYVSVYFSHPEWKRGASRYCTDVRPEPGEGAVWPFEVAATIRDKVLLTFEGVADVPPAYEVWLVDDVVQIAQNLRETPTYTLAGGGDGTPRPLKLVVGKRGFMDGELQASQEIPTRFELFPNFPNPFNPATTIRYGLPTAAPVSLTVYNVLGKKVATLEAGAQKEAGYHAVVWDGRGDAGTAVASGLYFVRMRAGRFVQTQTMVLAK